LSTKNTYCHTMSTAEALCYTWKYNLSCSMSA